MAKFHPHTSKLRCILIITGILLGLLAPLPMGSSSQLPDDASHYCTIFSVSVGEKVLFGNNEDYRYEPETSFISFVPPQTFSNFRNLPGFNDSLRIFGVMVVGSIVTQNEQDFYCPQGGMNDQGLCYDANSIPDEILDTTTGDWSPMSSHWDVLWHCATVEDVIAWYKAHPITYSPWNGQWNYVDATGDAVIVTATDGELAFISKESESYLVSTNFNRANPDSHYFDYPCWRYDTAVEMLAEIDNEDKLTMEACRDILDATHLESNLFSDINTLYSTVYDACEKEIYLYYNHDFDYSVTFHLEDELSDVSPLTANHSFYSEIVDRTYLMKDFFNASSTTQSPFDGVIVIGISISAFTILIIIGTQYFRKRTK